MDLNSSPFNGKRPKEWAKCFDDCVRLTTIHCKVLFNCIVICYCKMLMFCQPYIVTAFCWHILLPQVQDWIVYTLCVLWMMMMISFSDTRRQVASLLTWIILLIWQIPCSLFDVFSSFATCFVSQVVELSFQQVAKNKKTTEFVWLQQVSAWYVNTTN